MSGLVLIFIEFSRPFLYHMTMIEKAEEGNLSPEDGAVARGVSPLADKLLSVTLQKIPRDGSVLLIQSWGEQIQQELHYKSGLMERPMAKMVHEARDGGMTGRALKSLLQQINVLDPYKISQNPLRLIASRLPGIDTPLERWYSRYQSAEPLIRTQIQVLRQGKAQLSRDNIILRGDLESLNELIDRLEKRIKFGELLRQEINERLLGKGPEEKESAEREILAPLEERLILLREQLLVHRQGVMTSLLIIDNNTKVIEGIDRTLQVTVKALEGAAILVVSLQAHQDTEKALADLKGSFSPILPAFASLDRLRRDEDVRRVIQP
ncbi:MAG: toxic anion resistance protein [Spirochaetales bacterium]|nr:toxic anion resistance protein [Spirochaetales bacterium]